MLDLPVRQCDDCKTAMAPYTPRKKVGGKFLCPACVATPRGGMVSSGANIKNAMRLEPETMSNFVKVAHDSGDQFRIFHCPFCGSGQLTARSEGGAECGFCATVFLVKVQPAYPAMPQTQDGILVDMPGVPSPDAAGGIEQGNPEQLDEDPNAPVDPEALDDSGELPEDFDGEENPEDANLPFNRKSMRTQAGVEVSTEDYMRHLALKITGKSPRVVRSVRASRD